MWNITVLLPVRQEILLMPATIREIAMAAIRDLGRRGIRSRNTERVIQFPNVYKKRVRAGSRALDLYFYVENPSIYVSWLEWI